MPNPDRKALADSKLELVNTSISKLRSGALPTIYIVPQTIRQVNEVAYEPQIVSIGPYHHGKKSLLGMEENNWLYLHSFLSHNPNHRLEDYLKAMEELEDKAGSYYSDNVAPHVGNEFVKMMVFDACFIVEFFLRFDPMENIAEFFKQMKEELEQKEKEQKFFLDSNRLEPICGRIGMRTLIRYDLLLFENQIPFFVLERIFKVACPVNVPHLLEKMALHFFEYRSMPWNENIGINDSYYHLLHLFHSHLIPIPANSKEEPNLSCIPKIKPNLSRYPKIKSVLNKLKNLLIIFLPCSNKAQLPITERQMIPCAVDLQLAGVEFKKNKESNSILNVKFSHGVLEMPPLLIQDYSETLFRNLIAFEQCCLEPEFHVFTTYLVFMDYLVNTSKDVALLHRNGIIDNMLGSDDEVARLFNRLCIGIFHNFKESYLSDVKENVQKHCENKRNMWRATLKRDYFSNPWSVISLIAASVLLLLTIIQTFFTVFPYHGLRS